MRSQFCVYTDFFLLLLFVFTFFLSVQIAGSYIYMYIHIFFLRVEQTDPDIWSHCPLNLPTLRPFFSLCYPCRVTEPLMVALYLHACNRYIRIHVDVHRFVCSSRSNCATTTLPISVLWFLIQHTHHPCKTFNVLQKPSERVSVFLSRVSVYICILRCSLMAYR